MRTLARFTALVLTSAVLWAAPPSARADEPVQQAAAPAQASESESRAKPAAAASTAAEPPPVVPPYFPVNLSLIHPFSTNAAAPDLWTHFDVALILGRVGFVDGLQVGVVDWISHDLRGAQIGVASAISRHASGLQVGAAFAFTDGNLEGVQAAGIFGWASQDLAGVQLAMVANQTYGDLEGVQAATIVNVERKRLEGVQAGGAVNVGRVDGLQIAPINISQEMRGLQIGVINVARNIDGLQIGVINVTDNLRGESLGVVPLPRKGGIHPAAWASNSLFGNVGIKFASLYAYSILSVALHSVPREPDAEGGPRQPIFGAGFTIGARFELPIEPLTLASDLGAYRLFRDRIALTGGHDEVYKTRILIGFPLARRLTPFMGAGAFVSLRGVETLHTSFGPELTLGLEL